MTFNAVHNGKIEKGRASYDDICEKADALIGNSEQLLAKNTEFLDDSFVEEVRTSFEALVAQIKDLPFVVRISNFRFASRKKAYKKLIDNIDARVTMHNDKVAANLVGSARELIGEVEGRTLDDQQMKCIVKPMANHLVIAGAGTGKTTTIVGKIKYLLMSGACKPEDILVLSFTNASASEMSERINKETGAKIAASTFHKLGLNIINSVDGIMPKITSIQLPKFTKEQLAANMQNSKYLELLCKYFLSNYKYDTSEFDFKTKQEYDEYLRTNPPVTMKGDKVKSYGEMDIANFLYQNGIAYEYEKEYAYDTRTEDRAQYYPDFYLTDYGYYIEYFGINEKGEVPAYFTAREGKTPSQEYRESMEWKRAIHKEKGTVMLECYAYERSRGELVPMLEKKLHQARVEFKPVSPDAMWDSISESNSKNVLSAISELIATVISLMKSNECDIAQLRSLSMKNLKIIRNAALIDLIVPIYDAYKAELEKRGEIDFNDMINNAVHMVREGKYVNPYKYVIVDEYQDISKSRYSLLKALRDSSHYNLFCVGDDWQSIYRFTGSDLDYILNFSKYWGPSEQSKIETTYRFTDSLIDISGTFVMQNPAQIKKSIKGVPSDCGFALEEISGFEEQFAITNMLRRLHELPQNSTVFFIGRYTFDSRLLSDCSQLECKYDVSTQMANVVLPDRKDLKMQFLTAHKSKGLQADYVFIINNKDRGMGFPSKIQDDPLVDCLLEGKESFPFAEERRLFYVALTRAKKKAFLVTDMCNSSAFTIELRRRYGDSLWGEAKKICPVCGGILVRRNGQYGAFYGCSNYRSQGCTYKLKIEQTEGSSF